jgi:nitrogenase molybdenum-iron protein alpha/beta subunit
MGYPVFDRLGNSRRCHVGYRGTMELLFEMGNIFLEAEESACHQDYEKREKE